MPIELSRGRTLHGSSRAIGLHGVALLAILWAMPWPLASNRIWAQDGWLCVALVLVLARAWTSPRLFEPGAWFGVPRGMRLHMALLAAWTALVALQLVPVPGILRDFIEHARVPGFPMPRQGWAPISVDPYSTSAYLAKALLLLALQWLLLDAFDNKPRLQALVWAWLLAGGFEAVLAVVLFAAGGSYTVFFTRLDQGVHAKGTFVYQNHFAGYMELMLALGIGWMIALVRDDPQTAGGGRWRAAVVMVARFLTSLKAPLRVLLIVLVVGLIASRSRAGNAAFFAGLWLTGGALWLALRRRGERHAPVARAVAVLLISIMALDVLIIGGVVGLNRVVQRIEDTHLTANRAAAAATAPGSEPREDVDHEETVSQRIAPGLRALRILEDFPVLGAGGGTFFVAYLPYKPSYIRGFYDHAHDDFVEFAVETGVVGFAILAAVVVWSQWRGWRLLLAGNSSRFERGLAFASVMGVSELLIHATVDFNLQNPTNAVLFLWLLSLPHWVLARRHRHDSEYSNSAIIHSKYAAGGKIEQV